MTELTYDALHGAIVIGDDDAVVAALSGRSESERRAVGPAVVALCKPSDHSAQVRYEFLDTATAALLGTATLSELKKVPIIHEWGTFASEASVAVLKDRRPTWLAGWVEHINDVQVRSSSRSEQTWPFTRLLIKAGLCERPTTDAYVLNMIRGIHYEAFGAPARWHGERERYREVYDAWLERWRAQSVVGRLREEPDLLEVDVWDLFRVRGRPSRMLTPISKGQVTGTSKSSKSHWGPALVELANEDRISRERLVRETVEALARNFPPGQLRWLIELHELLEVAPSERAGRLDDYVHLLASADANVVKFAVAELAQAIADGVVDAGPVLSELDPVLLTAPAVTAVAAVKLIDRVIVESPSLRVAAIEVLLTALSHVQPRVQEAAASSICRRWDETCAALVAAVHDHAALVGDPTRTRLLALQ